MYNFVYCNPTKIVFGKNTVSELSNLLSNRKKILISYGQGSIKENGVYDKVKHALQAYETVEFGGIEPNPTYETLMKAVTLVKDEKIDFLLSVGGGSVLDGTKFIAAAAKFKGEPWDILAENAIVESALPIGCVLTLSATGSEMNGNSVISKKSTHQKLHFCSPHVYPQFSILDPTTTYTLSERQIRNSIVDPFVHVTEQYLTYNVNAHLQDRQAEAILSTLLEQGPKALKNPNDYDARATLMWCATQALNGLVGCGVPQDWTSHMIGHEITALFGIDHAQSLAVVMPAVIRHQKKAKSKKLLSYANRVWNIPDVSEEEKIDIAISKTIGFFHSIGMNTKLSDYRIYPETFEQIAERISSRGLSLGENQNIEKKEIMEILSLCT